MFKNKSLKKDLSIALLLTLLSSIGLVAITIFQFNNISSEVLKENIPENMSTSIFMIISILQGTVMTLVMGFIGLKLCKSVNLSKGIIDFIYNDNNGQDKKYSLKKENLILTLIIALAFAFLTALSEKYIWPALIPELISTSSYTFNLTYFIGAVFYGGFGEEIMLRLFVMSLVVFILWKIFKRKTSKENIPSYIYWISIIIAALLFALGHLPATMMVFNITIFVILRMIILNGAGGILFGYLYWKKGFEYAVIAHMFSHIFMQLVLMPILF